MIYKYLNKGWPYLHLIPTHIHMIYATAKLVWSVTSLVGCQARRESGMTSCNHVWKYTSISGSKLFKFILFFILFIFNLFITSNNLRFRLTF